MGPEKISRSGKMLGAQATWSNSTKRVYIEPLARFFFLRNDGRPKLIQTRLERPQSQKVDFLSQSGRNPIAFLRIACHERDREQEADSLLSTGVRLTTCVGQDSRTWCALANLASRARLAATAMTAVDLRMRCTLSHPWRHTSQWMIKPALEATEFIQLGHCT